MKIAYLITAYKDPEQLKRLVESLGKKHDFYIHIDLKVDINPFISCLDKMKNVFFIKERVYVCWAGFSQVKAICNLIGAAINSDISYDRIVNITGMDYPIYSNDNIEEEFIRNKEKEYLIGYNITKSSSKPQKNKITRYWFFDLKLGNNMIIKRVTSIVNNIIKYIPLRKKDFINNNNTIIDIYFGSDYWALTYDCAKFVYETMKSNDKIKRYFKNCFAPSELFVQTIVFNSKYKNNAIACYLNENEQLYKLTPLHYIEYGNEIKIFDEKDFYNIINSSKMFVRKVSTDKSLELIKMINKYRIKDMKTDI